MIYQKTLCDRVTFSGVGIHTGKYSTVTLDPAPIDTGIVFYDKMWGGYVAASIENVAIGTNHHTVIAARGFQVETVEHLLAAFHFCELTNVIVTVRGPEIPILDGSAWNIIDLIYKQPTQRSGANPYYKPKISTQAAECHPIIIQSECRTQSPDGSYASLLPSDKFSIEVSIDFEDRSKMIGKQEYTYEPGAFSTSVHAQSSVSCARTFGFYEDMQKMHEKGKSLGASLENCLVLGPDDVVMGNQPYWPDEFVRHKVVDVIGDLMLAGHPILGKFIGHKPTHALVHELVRQITIY